MGVADGELASPTWEGAVKMLSARRRLFRRRYSAEGVPFTSGLDELGYQHHHVL